MSTTKESFSVGVDSGTIFIGDPCYQSRGRCIFDDWDAFCLGLRDHFFDENGGVMQFNSGVLVGHFGGDGQYRVQIERDEHGLVRSVTVRFRD